MEKKAFEILHAMERSWWYRGRSRVLAQLTKRAGKTPQTILDFGAGWGGMYEELSARDAKVYAYEPDEKTRESCRQRGYAEVFATEEQALARTYDCISILDVLEHIEDDNAFLEKAKQALAPGGYLLLSVPAFQFLWSPHDVEHHHFRRYELPVLTKRLQQAGYSVRTISYWNTLMFVPAALLRLLGKTGQGALSLPKPLDSLLYAVVWCESLVLRRVRLPFGTGLIAIVQKK